MNSDFRGERREDDGAKYFRWYRLKDCFQCRETTKQLLHGYDETGKLWKGHVCECQGYLCTGCGRLEDKEKECCR